MRYGGPRVVMSDGIMKHTSFARRINITQPRPFHISQDGGGDERTSAVRRYRRRRVIQLKSDFQLGLATARGRDGTGDGRAGITV